MHRYANTLFECDSTASEISINNIIVVAFESSRVNVNRLFAHPCIYKYIVFFFNLGKRPHYIPFFHPSAWHSSCVPIVLKCQLRTFKCYLALKVVLIVPRKLYNFCGTIP